MHGTSGAQAIQEQSVSGQLRRAIAAAGIHPVDLAAAAAIPLPDLLDFMCGDGPLDTAAVDRLAAHLHCELVQPL